MTEKAPPSVTERLQYLNTMKGDVLYALPGCFGQQRVEAEQHLARLRRQIAMLSEADRKPAALPEQRRKFA